MLKRLKQLWPLAILVAVISVLAARRYATENAASLVDQPQAPIQAALFHPILPGP